MPLIVKRFRLLIDIGGSLENLELFEVCFLDTQIIISDNHVDDRIKVLLCLVLGLREDFLEHGESSDPS